MKYFQCPDSVFYKNSSEKLPPQMYSFPINFNNKVTFIF